MSLDVVCDFGHGCPAAGKTVDLADAIDELRRAQAALARHSVASVLDVIDGFATALLDRAHDIHQGFANSGIPFIAGWCRRANLEAYLDEAFQPRTKLDRFVDGRTRDRAYRAFPKGLISHWMAGNVPTLSILSLLFGVLTKNANIVKLASGSDELLASLLRVMASVKAPAASDVARSIFVIR